MFELIVLFSDYNLEGIMYQNATDLLNLKDEIKKTKNELSYLLEISKQNEKLFKEEPNKSPLKDEIKSLKKDINSLRIINDKTIDFLLLKIESNFDKQKQMITAGSFGDNYLNNNLDVISNDLINSSENLVKDNNLLNSSKLKLNEYEKIINSKENEINYLNNKIQNLDKDLSDKSELINILSQKDFSDELSDLIDFWENKISYIKKESNEKDETIFSLKEEIMILKSIIDEKDRTIDFLRGE